MKAKSVLLAASIASLLPITAFASTLTWDPNQTNGTTPGGAGTWDYNTTPLPGDWFTTSDGQWTDTTGVDTAIFGGTGGAVAIGSGGVTANGLTFNSTGYTLSGGNLTLTGTTPTVTVTNATDTATISSVVAGSGFTLSGAGTLLLSGANTFTGPVTIASGTLQLGNASALGTTTNGTTVNSGGVLDLNGQAIGAEPLTLNGTGISSGGALINSSATAASLSGTINVATASSIGGSGALTLSGVISGSNGFTKVGNGTLTLSGANTFNGQLLISSGIVKAGNAAALGGSGAGNETVVQSGGTLDVNGTALTSTEIVDIAGTGVGGAGALINTGASQQNALNRVVLTADAAVGGTSRFDIRAGTTPTLDLAGFTLTKVGANDFHVVSGNITSGNINITAGTFAIEGTTTVAAGGTITIGPSGTLGFYQNNTGAVLRDIADNGGNMASLGVGGTINSNIALGTGTTSTLNSSAGGVTTLAGVISGSGALTKAGTDTFTLSGTNTYTGATTINAGRLTFSGSNVSSITVASGGTLGGAGSTTGTLTLNAGGFLAIAGGTTTTAFTANAVNATGPANITFDSAGVFGRTYTVFNYGAGGFTGGISNLGLATGHGTFSDSGSAVSVLYAGVLTDVWNTTTGAWSTAAANWTNSFDNKFATGDTAVFNNPGAASTVTVSGTITPASILVNNSSNAYTFAGSAISGTGSLVKTGAGTLTLSVQETYTGGTIVNGGIMDLTGGGGSTGTIRGTATIYSGGTLRLSAGDVTGYSGGASVLNTINLVGGTLNINTTLNQTLGSAVINMTGGSITGVASSNLDFFGGNSALNTFASSTTSTINAPISPVRQGNTTFTVAQGNTASGIDLDILSKMQNGNASAQLIKAGAGTMRLDAANTVTAGSMAVNGGTLILGFSSTVTSNILASTNALVLGGGTLSLTNTSGAAVTQTFAGLTTTTKTASQILLGAATETLTLGTLTSAGANSALNINTAAGGADATTSNAGTSIAVLTGQTAGNAINAGFTVTDSTGFGLATVNASNQLMRLTNTTALPASGASSSTNYLVNNSTSITSTESAGSITVDTTAAAGGTLTLGSGVTASTNTWNFGGVGSNTYTVTGGTGITSVASGGTLNFNNYNAGLVTIATPIVANGTNAVIFGGTGTTLLSTANTYTGTTTISSGTVQLGNATSLGSTAGTTVSSGATLDLNGQTVGAVPLTLNGTLINSSTATTATLSGTVALSSAIATAGGNGNLTLSGVISGAGALTKTGNGTLTLSNGGDTYTGNIIVNGGTLATANQGNGTSTSAFGAETSSRTITINPGATLAMNINNVFGNGGTALGVIPTIINMGGTLKSTNYNILGNLTLGNGATMTSSLAATGGYTGFEFKGGSTVTVLNTGGNTSGSTISSPGINLAGTVAFNVNSVTGTSTPDLTISSVVNNASADNGSIAATLVKNGAGTLSLTAAPTYTGGTVINGGTYQVFSSGTVSFPSNASVAINNGSTFQVTGDRYNFSGVTFTFDANGGGTFDYGGTGNSGGLVFTGTNTFTTNGGAQDKLTTSTSSNYNLNNVGVNFNVARGTDSTADLLVSAPLNNSTAATTVTKTGNGIVMLSGSNTYSGATAVNAGTLVVSGSISGSSLTTVASGATLTGTGAVGAITINSGGTISAGNKVGTIGTLYTGDMILNGTYKLTLDSTANVATDLSVFGDLTLTGSTLATTDLTLGPGGVNLTIAQYTGSLFGTFSGLAQGASLDGGRYTIDYGTLTPNAITLIAVPEPGALASLLGGFAMLAGLRRFRRRF